MIATDALRVLLVASAFDEREPSKIQASVWAEELTALGLDVDLAIEAVRRYYRENPDGRVRPGHLSRYAWQVRQERRDDARHREIEARRQFMLERHGGGTHRFDGDPGEPCDVCGLPDEDNPRHARDRGQDHAALLAALRPQLPPGSTAFREQLTGKMRPQRALPGE